MLGGATGEPVAELVDYLRKLDTNTLEQLAGTTIVRAVRSVMPVDRESALARLVSDKFGALALSEAKLRGSLFDALPRDAARAYCRTLNIPIAPDEIPQATIHSYFSRNYSEKKSQQLVQLLELPLDYVKIIQRDERPATEIVEPTRGSSVKLRGFLHPFQKRLKDELIRAISEFVSRVMVQMPTGAGKTATALEAAIDVFRLPFQKRYVVWIVNSNELAEQALETFRTLWAQKGDHPVSVHRLFGGFEPEFDSQEGGFVFASFATLRGPISQINHKRHSAIWRLIKATDLLIVDEAHSSVADTYEQIIRAFVDSATARLVGLSATPARAGGEATQALSNLYTGQLISVRDDGGHPVSDVVGYLQERGYLAYVHSEELESGVQSSDNDEGAICKTLAENPERNELILKQIERAVALKEPTLVFSCTKDHVFALIALCRHRNIQAEFIVGETPMAERNRMLDRFRKDSCGVLINYEILSTGIDLPNIRRLIITRPVGSPILFSQILGRALRGPKNGGNKSNTVVSIRDNLLSFPNANYVYQSFANEFLSAN